MLCDLFDHMRWEDEHVAPVFRKSVGWGEDSAARLATDHREQRRVMRHEFERLRDPTIPIFLLARDLLEYLEILRRDMLDEERWMLDPVLLGNEGAKVEVRIE